MEWSDRARGIILGLAASALPTLAMAQMQPLFPTLAMPGTEPLLPLTPLPTGPQAPGAPGEPVERGLTVADRPRPELNPVGGRVGDFFFFPQVELDESYNDNIYATPAHKEGDFITQLAPRFDLLSNLPQNAINVHGGAFIGRYASHSGEDYNDAFGSIDGRIDLTNNDQLIGTVGVTKTHIPRYAPSSVGNAAEPITFNTYTADLGAARTGLRFGYQADMVVQRQEYESVPLFGGGILSLSQLNYTSYEPALRLNYELQPNYQAFIRGAVNFRQYDHAQSVANPSLSSQGFRADIGARIDLTGVTYAEFYVGWLQQDYYASSYGTVKGPDFGGNVVWNVTSITSITLNALRTVQDANQAALLFIGAPPTSPAFLNTVVGLRVDHELLRNVLIDGVASYTNDAFHGIGLTTNVYAVGAGIKYLFNRNLYVGLDYTYQRQDATGPGSALFNFTQNIAMVRLSTQF